MKSNTPATEKGRFHMVDFGEGTRCYHHGVPNSTLSYTNVRDQRSLNAKRPFSSSLKNRMSDDGSFNPKIYVNRRRDSSHLVSRINRQLNLVEECFELLQDASQFVDDCSESHGYWAMSVKEQRTFWQLQRSY